AWFGGGNRVRRRRDTRRILRCAEHPLRARRGRVVAAGRDRDGIRRPKRARRGADGESVPAIVVTACADGNVRGGSAGGGRRRATERACFHAGTGITRRN